ncbi:MAG TPA: EAL domain-containing protein [Usitatibacter sp.]|nr:EAL domain-containing protein [Usitatibacter sp.]
MIIDMKDYPPAARLYWWTVIALGYASLAWGIWGVLNLATEVVIQVLIGAAVAAIVGLFPVRIPGAKTAIAGAEIFIFLMLVLYGPAAAILAAALEGFVASWSVSRRWTSRIGTPAMASLAMLVCATAFAETRAHIHANGSSTAVLLIVLIAFSGLYFIANTMLTSTLFALKNHTPVTPIAWVRSFMWIGLAYVTSASIAGMLFVSFERFGLPVLLVAVPVIAMFLSTLHSYFQRKESDERHVEELKASESRFHSAFTHAAIGMALVTSDGRFIQANKSFCEMLGRPNVDLLATSLRSLVNPDDMLVLQGLVEKLIAGQLQSVHAEVRGEHRDGSDVWMSLNISLARDWEFRTHNLIVQAQDISARRRAEAELYHNAYHDSLTQLSNRTHFNEQLNRAIARVHRHPEQRFAVMYLDFDRFKMVNDSLGHKAGDELLVNLAQRLQGVLRPTDLIARLGGDEFAILLEDIQRERDAVDLAERIQKELMKPFLLGDMEVTISASIGMTFSSNGYQTSEQIIRDADIAMYKAKSKGKGQYALFDSSLHQHVASQLKLENELRRALGQGQIYLEYQPIYSLAEQKLIGFEALVRWKHPERGALEPALFIPTAEETGLIVPLGNWVLTEACRQMKVWKDLHGDSGLKMSVNVSSLQLTHPEFVARVREALDLAQLRPGELTLEVTESVLMDGIENAVSTLNELRAMGVTLSIDDFGTGYSSLNYLATLPIDALKVDRSFIEKMVGDGEGNEIVRAIFKLGQALSKQVFAEGIETGAQLTLLKELGCEFGQGFLLSRPLSAERAGGFVSGKLRAFAPA